MLHGFSWVQFGVFIVGCLSLYYLWLISSGKLGRNKKKKPPDTNSEKPSTKRIWRVEESPITKEVIPPVAIDEREESQEANVFENLEILADNIHQIIMDSVGDVDKPGLIKSIKAEIEKYPELNRQAFRAAIRNIIIKSTAVTKTGLEFTDEEVDGMWKRDG